MDVLDFVLVIGTACVANAVWGRYVDPWLDSRPRKAMFVEPERDPISNSSAE